MFKKIFALCLALLLVLSLAACGNTQDPTADNGDQNTDTSGGNTNTAPSVSKTGTFEGCTIAWALYTDGTLKLSGEGALSEINSTEEGNDDRPFAEYISSITAVTVGEGITALSPYTFKNCTQLRSVVLPTTLAEIPSSAFENCTLLRTVLGGTGLVTIRDNAFANCRQMTALSISASLRTVELGAFYNCAQSGLTLRFTGDTTEWQDTLAAMTVEASNEAFENATVTYFPRS